MSSGAPTIPGADPYYVDDVTGIILYFGDARKLLPKLDAASIDMVFTDPPYGHNNNDGDDLIRRRERALGEKPKVGWRGRPTVAATSQNPARPIANDGKEADDLVKWFFSESARLLKKPGCCCCCCCSGGGPDPQFARWSLWLDKVMRFKQMVIFDKGPMGMGWHYRRSYETILVAEQPGKSRWYGGNEVENIIRPGAYGIRKIIPSASQHPTEKPVELARHFIRLHSEPGDIILDPFAGHGTTLAAAKMEGRRAIGIELSEEFCLAAKKKLMATRLGFVQPGIIRGKTKPTGFYDEAAMKAMRHKETE